MELTGKCKDDFEKWFLRNSDEDLSLLDIETRELIESKLLLYFYMMSDSAQFGVFQEFFDSVGIHISDFADTTMLSKDEPNFELWGYSVEIEWDYGHYESPQYKTRELSHINSIEKSNELYNNK